MQSANGKRRRLALAGVAMGCAVALLAACSSSGSKTASGGTTGASSSAGGSTSAAASSSSGSSDTAALTAQLQKYSGPAPIDLQPLASKPATGLKVVYLANSNAPTDVTNGQAFTAAAKLLGWSPSTINYAGDPATLSSSIQQAIGQNPKPKAIVLSGQDPSAFANALKQASAAGVPMFDGGVPATPTGMANNGLSGVSIGKIFLTTEGALSADWILRDTGSTQANVALVTLAGFPTLTTADAGFTAEYAKYCPSCKVSTINAQLADIGKALPASIVSNLQSNPSIKYLYFPYGDMSIGVAAALKSANLSTKMVSSTASPGTYADLKAGTMSATLSCSTQVQGYLEADLVARFYETNKPVSDDITPIQIFDASNSSSPTLPISPADYQAQFSKLWQLS